MTEQQAQEMLDWLYRLPRELQRLAAELPPKCMVKAREGVTLSVPAPDEVGSVVGYNVHPEHGPVAVVLGAEAIGHCRVDWLEVVATTDDMDGDFVRAVCGLEAA